ncbi:unnamed protein product [Amaranthus hypochondriacus]
MEDSNSIDDDDQFLDALDEFPFYDCSNNFDSSLDSSSQSYLSPPSFPNSNFSVKGGLCRRHSLKTQKDLDKVESSSKTIIKDLNEEKESSTVTRDEISEESPSSMRERESEDGSFNLLIYLAELIVKAIGFQFNLLISFISFPFWVLYYSCMFAINPLLVIGIGKSFFIGKIARLWNLIGDTLSPLMSEWLKKHESWLGFALRCGWGLFWSVYVCSILVILLISSFVIGGLLMRYYVVEEPFQLKQGLNFDYTKTKPVAFVPIVICSTSECTDKNEVVDTSRFVRVIPFKHKLQTTVIMVLPESDYNRNLGIFQVRAEFLSENGKSLASFSHPCMLAFRSQPIRLLLTFFKIVPLVAGYLSETQTLKLTFNGYHEGVIPTACLKITMEQRAEFRPGAGIPEVYDAFVHLESELPFFKRILWHWRRTMFVWLSMTIFAVELVLALLCCRPVIMPRTRCKITRIRSNHSLSTHQVQR